MENKPSRTLATLMIILFVYMIVLSAFLLKPPVDAIQADEPEMPTVKVGQYTIFHYTDTGWCNPRYVTEYYIQDRIIYYKLRESKGDYLELALDNCLIEQGWIEDPEELTEYGHWTIGSEGW